jgi:predicted lipoprotein with Yx(FWY)xxD motif
MNTIRTYASLIALAAVTLLVAAACGGSSDSATGEASAATVGVSSVGEIGEVLVDSEGNALYAADEEANGMVLCVEACATVWEPLTVGDGQMPTGDNGLAGNLGVVERPDGGRQVTFSGRLLYSFVEDPEPGTVTGNGFTDTFAGREFVWHVATPDGISSSSQNVGSSGDGFDY